MDEFKPWQQLDGEPNRAFEHFLIYLYSPMPRTLTKAYRVESAGAKEVPDSWKREAKLWQWGERAHAYDVEQITKHGQEVVVNMVGAMRLLSQRIMESLSTQRGEVWTYEQTITAFRLLSELVPAETVASLRATSGSGDVPAIGSRPATSHTVVVDFAAIAPGSVGNSEPSGKGESGVQWPALGEDSDGRGAGNSGSGARGEGVVDSANV